MVTSISFCPNVSIWLHRKNDEVFVSGCLDKIIRIWHIHRKKVIDYINTQDLITAITYSPTGNNIFVGFHNGKCSNFEINVIKILIQPKLKYNSSFECKNKFGKYSKGTKITGLEFVNKNELLVTSGDSRIRLMNINVRNL
jgi:WD40 repeat protein